MMTYIILYKFYSPIFHKNTIFHLHLQIAKKIFIFQSWAGEYAQLW